MLWAGGWSDVAYCDRCVHKVEEVIDMRSYTTSSSTIKEVRQLFSRFGILQTFVSNNEPQLVSEEVQRITTNSGAKV